jgi:hypothetical protein
MTWQMCFARFDSLALKDPTFPCHVFTGLEIPADVGAELGMLRGGLPGARWIDPDNYHATLHRRCR